MDELKSIDKSRWISLRNSDFYFSYMWNGNKVNLQLDFQLQSTISYFIIKNINSFDLSIEFAGDSCSSMVVSADYDGVVDDELAEDSATAFIEDRAQVSRPRRLKDWENVLGDVRQQFVGGVNVV
ncbi:hypothetical protein MKX03_008686, partial [Papaver bracteatum]